jgi:hypothetical protein
MIPKDSIYIAAVLDDMKYENGMDGLSIEVFKNIPDINSILKKYIDEEVYDEFIKSEKEHFKFYYEGYYWKVDYVDARTFIAYSTCSSHKIQIYIFQEEVKT